MKLKFLTLALFVGAIAQAQTPIVSGYVHGVTSFVDTDQNGDKGDVGFFVPEAAVHLQHEVAGVGGFVDLPFSANSGTTKIDFDFSSSGQAYLFHSTEGGLKWKLGQWDAPFGVESVEAPTKAFNTGGQVAANIPGVLRGLSLGYTAGTVGLEWFVVNPSTFLTNSASTSANNDKLETGLNLTANLDKIALNLGGMYGRHSGKNHWATFFGAKYDAGTWNTALEIDYLKDKDVIKHRGGGKLLTALHLNANLSDPLSVGARGEFLRHGDASIWTATVGPKYEVEKDVSLRADYTIARTVNDLAVGAKSVQRFTTHTIALGAVAKF